MQVIVQSFNLNSSRQDGTPYVDKNGNPFKMAILETQDGRKASMYVGKFQQKLIPIMQSWTPGKAIDVEFEQKGEYLNFKIPSKMDKRLSALELRISRIEGILDGKGLIASKTSPEAPQAVSETAQLENSEDTQWASVPDSEHINVDEIPF